MVDIQWARLSDEQKKNNKKPVIIVCDPTLALGNELVRLAQPSKGCSDGLRLKLPHA